MTVFFDIYGVTKEDIDEVAVVLSKTLNITFNPHENSTWGDYYLFHSEDWKEKIYLQKNLGEDEDGDVWRRPEFKQYPLLIEVNASITLAKNVENRIKQELDSMVSFLRHKEYPD